MQAHAARFHQHGTLLRLAHPILNRSEHFHQNLIDFGSQKVGSRREPTKSRFSLEIKVGVCQVLRVPVYCATPSADDKSLIPIFCSKLVGT